MPNLETWGDLHHEMTLATGLRSHWRDAVQLRMTDWRFTAREQEVTWELFRGKSNKEIGSALGVSEQTVKNFMTTILAKCRAQDRSQVVIALLGLDVDEERSHG